MKMTKKRTEVIFVLFLGILLRYVCMNIGYNYDWESYCIVGEISSRLHNVYALTSRYNYAPVFFCIQGLLYRLSEIVPQYQETLYRWLMVGVLTLADVGITVVLLKKYSKKAAFFFFLNPISIIITGYHNQFDNIAILLALLTISFYNEEEQINKRDFYFALFMALSLMTKHILFLMPLFIVMRPNLKFVKKVIYACAPVGLFILSFIPFAISPAGRAGILENVFFYRSNNNSPLLGRIYGFVSFPERYKFVVYILILIALAFISRTKSYENQLFIYCISMVCFASAIANQYLVIPIVALCVLDCSVITIVYYLWVFAFFCIDYNEFHLITRLSDFPDKVVPIMLKINGLGYEIAAWILAIALLICLIRTKENTIEKKA